MLTLETPASSDAVVALLPKNSGLAGQIARVRERGRLPEDAWPLAVRGEDVPFLACELAALGRRVMAFTGEDLLDEWLADGNALHARLQRRSIAWNDPAAMYGAPALCLLGAGPGVLLERRSLRVMVCGRYRRTAERFLDALRDDGVILESFAVGGSLETLAQNGVADLVVDVVVSGRTMREAGLQTLRVIRTSDLAVLESR